MALNAVVEAIMMRERRMMMVTTRKRARSGIFRLGETYRRNDVSFRFP